MDNLSTNVQGSLDYSRHLTKKKAPKNEEMKMKTVAADRLSSKSKSTVIEIVDPVKTQSNPDCPKCNPKQSFLRRKFLAKIFDRWILERKLEHYGIEFVKTRNPLNILKKHFTSPLVAGTSSIDWKFLPSELGKMSTDQRGKLKTALQTLILNKEKELQIEDEERLLQTTRQKNLKIQLHDLEVLARSIMKPYVNLYPSCEELNRLMLA